MKVAKSFFQLERYLIEKVDIDVKETEEDVINYSMDINPQVGSIIEGDKFFSADLTLEVTIKGRGKRNKLLRKVYVKIKGIFKAEKNSDDTNLNKEKFERLCKINGVMNLLIITRAFIASLSAQLGVEPILIPLVNLFKTPIFEDDFHNLSRRK